MRGKRWAGIIIIAAFLVLPAAGCVAKKTDSVKVDQIMNSTTGSAANESPAHPSSPVLVEIADELYEAANVGNRQLAYAALVRLEKEAKKPAIRSFGQTPGWAAFDHTITDAKKALSGPINHADAYLAASRLKLAVDALYQSAPLWLQYQKIIEDDMVRLHQLWIVQWEDRPSAELAALQVLRLHAERFEVAALMERPEEKVAQFEDQLKRMEYTIIYAAKSAEIVERNKTLDQVWSELDHAAAAVFQDSSITKAATGGIVPNAGGAFIAGREKLATMFIAAFVMGVLAFVGFRKYRFEENHGAAYPPPKSPWEQ